jgi:small subunit ribosomal protein S24e
MIHPEMANVSKEQIRAKLAQMFKSKEEAISIYGLKTKFGGGRSTGFALIYDSFDLKKKFDGKNLLKRVRILIFCFAKIYYILIRISFCLNP